MDFDKRTWAEVNLDNVAWNAGHIKDALGPGCRMMAVVKADAYGHGYRHVSLTLQEKGADWFGVSNIDEALCLRGAGITRPILIFGPTPGHLVRKLYENNITQTVYSREYASLLHGHAQKAGVTLDIHIKADTGMSRLGFDAYAPDAAQAIARACGLPRFNTTGIFTHFAVADEPGEDSVSFTKNQFEAFEELCSRLSGMGVDTGLRHCCNSAALMRYPHMRLDMVRPGLILYGLYPSDCCRDKLELRPAMEIKSLVSMVKDLKPGQSVSYGRLYTAASDMRVATVPIGYADGYRRLLSNKGRMITGGAYASVIGRVCMDQLMLDVTGIPGVEEGNPVTVVGEENGLFIGFDELAENCGTVSYEMICLIGKRVPRIYLTGGRVIASMDNMRDGGSCV